MQLGKPVACTLVSFCALGIRFHDPDSDRTDELSQAAGSALADLISEALS